MGSFTEADGFNRFEGKKNNHLFKLLIGGGISRTKKKKKIVLKGLRVRELKVNIY